MLASAIGAALEATGRAVLEALPPAGLGYVLARSGDERPLLVVTASEERAEAVAADLRVFGITDLAAFPADPHVPFDAAARDTAIGFAQSALRHRLMAGEAPRIIVAPASALQLRWPPAAAFEAATVTWRTGEQVPFDAIAEQLTRCGYNKVPFVEDPGTFAVRGSIVDLYPPGRELPVRLDLFGDELTSIKPFAPETQKTFEGEPELTVHPIRDVVFAEANVARARARLREMAEQVDVPTRRMREIGEEIEQRDYFYGIEALWPLFYEGSEAVLDRLLGPDTVVVIDEAEGLADALAERDGRATHERDRTLARPDLALPLDELVVPAGDVLARLEAQPQVQAVALADDRLAAPIAVRLLPWTDLARELELRRKDSSRGEILDPVAEDLRKRLAERQEVFLATSSRGNAERLRELLRARNLDLPVWDALPPANTFGEPRRHPRCAVVVAPLSAGFIDDSAGVALLTELELFGAAPRPRAARRHKRAAPDALSTLKDLREGDHVIHVDHGIGRYLGLKRLVTDGVDGDYVHLEYAGGDRLYVPVYHLNLLQRHQGPGEVRVDKLGGTRWEKTKQRVKDSVLAVAHKILAVQAQRKAQPGIPIPAPDDHFRSFEARFVYEETDDQRKAIDDVIKDLTSGVPMDRLVCGDVGFGKTEVAVRAAFLTVQAEKQVAILVPTTVLAEQHRQTFSQRLEGEPVNIDVLSRFRTQKEARDIAKRVAEGKVDILIGTHRMLAELEGSTGFRDLGLLVVDEEHRFGVRHKERIKELRSQVHVLTLSATPIPRTMHMAMMGLRDLSIISTPPVERTAIKTEVTLFDEEVITEAIRRELHRGGQVFVVHNRVQSIDQMAQSVVAWVPEAKVAVAHGQMKPTELEKIMVDFVTRKTNVLVCTAIVESGIDIPSANTMIINRADTFGLAQLHQLRGRIGRGRERAYAYLLLPRAQKMTHEASERLAVLKRFSDLGAGFSIASQDLDLRGAGDLLGSDQSGNVNAVGFELYMELLAEAVEVAKGQRHRHEVEPDIRLPVAAVLPESYVQQPVHRLEYYQRMANADSDERIYDICAEIEAVYGEAPPELHCLGEVMVIRRRLRYLGASALTGSVTRAGSEEGGEKDAAIKIGVAFLPDAPVDRDHLAAAVQREPERYRILPSGRLAITVPTLADTEPLQFLQRVRGELGRLRVY